jgi:hypothetical protein
MKSLEKVCFFYFAEFLESFCASWDYDSIGWLPLVCEIKELYSTWRLIEDVLGLPMEDIEINHSNEDHRFFMKSFIILPPPMRRYHMISQIQKIVVVYGRHV